MIVMGLILLLVQYRCIATLSTQAVKVDGSTHLQPGSAPDWVFDIVWIDGIMNAEKYRRGLIRHVISPEKHLIRNVCFSA